MLFQNMEHFTTVVYFSLSIMLHLKIVFQLIEFLNTFYGALDTRLKKFRVYQVHNMADEFMIVAGMPQNIGTKYKFSTFSFFPLKSFLWHLVNVLLWRMKYFLLYLVKMPFLALLLFND